MRIQLIIGELRLDATLSESAAARDLVAQLPVTIDMTDHGGVEKTGPLPSSLSLDGQPDGADPGVGDLGYYAPGNDLVLYYGDQSLLPRHRHPRPARRRRSPAHLPARRSRDRDSRVHT